MIAIGKRENRRCFISRLLKVAVKTGLKCQHMQKINTTASRTQNQIPLHTKQSGGKKDQKQKQKNKNQFNRELDSLFTSIRSKRNWLTVVPKDHGGLQAHSVSQSVLVSFLSSSHPSLYPKTLLTFRSNTLGPLSLLFLVFFLPLSPSSPLCSKPCLFYPFLFLL